MAHVVSGFVAESRDSIGSSLASSISGGTGSLELSSDYTFGFSLSGVGLRQQSKRRHSLRPETSLPFDKQAADPSDLVSLTFFMPWLQHCGRTPAT